MTCEGAATPLPTGSKWLPKAMAAGKSHVQKLQLVSCRDQDEITFVQMLHWFDGDIISSQYWTEEERDALGRTSSLGWWRVFSAGGAADGAAHTDRQIWDWEGINPQQDW